MEATGVRGLEREVVLRKVTDVLRGILIRSADKQPNLEQE